MLIYHRGRGLAGLDCRLDLRGTLCEPPGETQSVIDV